MLCGDIIQLVIAVIMAAGIIIALCMNKGQLNVLTRQLKLNFFAEYTRRYQQIILHFPENINDGNFDYEKLESDNKNRTLRYMRAYFDLCSEEYHLNSESHIDKKVWQNWSKGIEFAFSKKAFQDAWLKIIQDTKYDKDFEKWINGIVGNYVKKEIEE